MSIPWPFITQAANPVHVYDAETINIDQNLCFREQNGSLPVNGAPYRPTITYADWASGQQKPSEPSSWSVACEAASGLPNGLGYNGEVHVQFTVPPSGLTYINIHLDYGVKGKDTDFNPFDTFADRYDKGTGTCVGNATYYDALQEGVRWR